MQGAASASQNPARPVTGGEGEVRGKDEELEMNL